MYLIKNKQKRTLPNFYSKFIILFLFSITDHPTDDHGCPLISKTGIHYVCTVISATNTCMPGRQPKIIKIFQTEFQKLRLTIP